MSPKPSTRFRINLTNSSWIAYILAFSAGLLFLSQGWVYAHTQISSLDEGAYLVKGYLFMKGQYTIYQDYGPWSNHMPLSFYIPGVIQYLIGPGLDVARYFSLLLAALMLLGIWIVANRFGGVWWATGALFVYALNPEIIKMYSVTSPQVVIACMLAWVLVLILGEKRPLWQILTGACLAGIMLLTRINMMPVLPVVVLYILWENGIKAGLLSALVGLTTVFVGHLFFWPGILKIWARQIPAAISPFLNAYRYHIEITDIWNPDVSHLSQLMSILYSLRIHFVAVMGVVAACLFWARRSGWKSQSRFRASAFLLTLFFILLILHIWAALWGDFCVYCLDGYIAYFSLVGVLLVVVSFSSWNRQQPIWFQSLVILIILVTSTGLGFGAFQDIGSELLSTQIPRSLFNILNPDSGSVSLETILINKFQLEYSLLRRVLPTIVGISIGVLVIIAALIIYILTKQKYSTSGGNLSSRLPSYGFTAMVLFLIIGAALSPTGIFSGGGNDYDCTGNVLHSYREAGEFLAQRIPPGSKVYWMGGLSAVTLLYVPGIEIFPSQLNDGYSFKTMGESEELEKWGFWSKELALRWLEETDFALIEDRSFKDWHRSTVVEGEFEELKSSPLQVPCKPDSWIHIFKRNQ